VRTERLLCGVAGYERGSARCLRLSQPGSWVPGLGWCALGQEQSQDGHECNDLRYHVESDGDRDGGVSEPGQGQTANTASIRAKEKSVALDSLTIGDNVSSESVVISSRNSGAKNKARYKAGWGGIGEEPGHEHEHGGFPARCSAVRLPVIGTGGSPSMSVLVLRALVCWSGLMDAAELARRFALGQAARLSDGPVARGKQGLCGGWTPQMAAGR
jgi:hypothetical protein